MAKEKQILDYIKLNPYISQQELAEKVGLSRSAVANYIATLIKNGEIKGRAYILNDQKSIACIGGANLDRKATAKQKVSLYSSNPVTTTESCGGVARNVAENLSLIGLHTTLYTSIGNDKEGKFILEQAKNSRIDVSQVWTLTSARTGTYTALLDNTGEMIVSIADMDIYDQLTPSMFQESWSSISQAKTIFMDTNIPKDCIDMIVAKCKMDELFLCVDPVSVAKTEKLPASLVGIDLILPNRDEAEVLSGMKIRSHADAEQACKLIHERGVKMVILTLGKDGVFYYAQGASGHIPAIDTKVVDVTGAGDAFVAGVLYALTIGNSLVDACKYGITAASLTVQTKNSVSSQMKFLQEKVKELYT